MIVRQKGNAEADDDETDRVGEAYALHQERRNRGHEQQRDHGHHGSDEGFLVHTVAREASR
jgi:hypothetical protein